MKRLFIILILFSNVFAASRPSDSVVAICIPLCNEFTLSKDYRCGDSQFYDAQAEVFLQQIDIKRAGKLEACTRLIDYLADVCSQACAAECLFLAESKKPVSVDLGFLLESDKSEFSKNFVTRMPQIFECTFTALAKIYSNYCLDLLRKMTYKTQALISLCKCIPEDRWEAMVKDPAIRFWRERMRVAVAYAFAQAIRIKAETIKAEIVRLDLDASADAARARLGQFSATQALVVEDFD